VLPHNLSLLHFHVNLKNRLKASCHRHCPLAELDCPLQAERGKTGQGSARSCTQQGAMEEFTSAAFTADEAKLNVSRGGKCLLLSFLS